MIVALMRDRRRLRPPAWNGGMVHPLVNQCRPIGRNLDLAWTRALSPSPIRQSWQWRGLRQTKRGIVAGSVHPEYVQLVNDVRDPDQLRITDILDHGQRRRLVAVMLCKGHQGADLLSEIGQLLLSWPIGSRKPSELKGKR